MTMISKLIRTAAVTAAATIVAVGAVPAQATDFDQIPQGMLNVGKVDFNSQQDVNRVIKHLRRLALDMCTIDGSAAELMTSDAKTCYQTALRNGMDQIRAREQLAAAANGVHVAQAPVVAVPQK